MNCYSLLSNNAKHHTMASSCVLHQNYDKKYFDVRESVVNFEDELSSKSFTRILGKEISNDEISNLFAGGLSDSIITVGAYETHAWVEIKNPMFEKPIQIFLDKEDDGSLFITFHRFDKIQNTVPSLGTKMMQHIVTTARNMNINKIVCGAARAMYKNGKLVEVNGYYSWPRMGFDASIETVEQVLNDYDVELPKRFSTCKTLNEIMRTKDGRDFWKKNGQDIDLTFSLEDNSPNIKFLNNYLETISKKMSVIS